jgi:N-acetylmuramoyl-L-alanine amidase
MPGVIAEALFITNEADAEALGREETRDAIARGYKMGIDAYFGWLQAQLPQ